MPSAPKSEYVSRFAKLKTILDRVNVATLVVSSERATIDLIYLTGYIPVFGVAVLVWRLVENPILFMNVAWELPRVREETHILDVRVVKDPYAEAFRSIKDNYKKLELVAIIGLENVPSVELGHLTKGFSITSGSAFLRSLRLEKSLWEIECLQQAANIADIAMSAVPNLLERGLSEKAIARALKTVMLEKDTEGFSGPFIGSGPRAALPVAFPTERIPQKGELVVIDLGAVTQGYVSDICRTFVVGKQTNQQFEWLNAVNEALTELIRSIRPGIPANSLQKKAKDYFTKLGYGEAFVHHIGHDIGQDSGKLLNLQTDSTELVSGMALAIEPGIYFGPKGGVRIEDDVILEDGGARILTRVPRSF